jgi:hypothetical protein
MAWLVMISWFGEADLGRLSDGNYFSQLLVWDFLPWLVFAFAPLQNGFIGMA